MSQQERAEEEEGDDIFLDAEPLSICSLPREFQVIQESRVPLLQCSSSSSGRNRVGDRDFIIVAEFSELEGPIPLATIPSELDPCWKDLCLSNFVVHLMSTDYQVNSVGHFKLSEDTQVLRKNVFKDVHVFMEYFTLYDIKARGFVRPFCFGFVSKDHVKLDRKLQILIDQFDKITKLLKHSNRQWFSSELSIYLERLEAAKNVIICQAKEDNGDGENEKDRDRITLEQIAHQYSEIDSILGTVNASLEDDANVQLSKQLDQVKELLKNDKVLLEVLEKLEIVFTDPVKMRRSFSQDIEDMPLVHPLKMKGEPLRPLTVLAQVGTVKLIGSLLCLGEEHSKDLMFTEMDELTDMFRRYFVKPDKQKIKKLETETEAIYFHPNCYHLSHPQGIRKTVDILKQLHGNFPSSSSPSKSSKLSFQSASEDVDPEETSAQGTHASTGRRSTNTSTISTSSIESNSKSQPQSEFPPASPSLSPTHSVPDTPETEEIISNRPWWSYGELGTIERGQPGYWILKFFQTYHKVAHHILYSILLGRPIVVCGSEEQQRRVNRILTALQPLILSSKPQWKLLRWHRGVLVPKHIKQYNLIGLCIPERLSVHDLINSRDQNDVTIFNISGKKSVVLGPAYSGQLLSPLAQSKGKEMIQAHFHSDLSFLMYLGTILTQLETQVYMLKSLQEKEKNKKKFNFKEIPIEGSDAGIIRFLATQVTSPGQAMQLFSSHNV